jgi:hypothetical protein
MATDRGTDDLLDRVREEIDERMAELRPLVDEHAQLLAAAESLALDGEPPRVPRRGRRARTAKPAGPASANTVKTAKKPAAGGRRSKAVKAPKGRPRGPRSATQQAIEAALEHGSHTLAELVLVTAIETAPIRAQLGRLQKAGVVSRIRRDGKTAYSLLNAAAAASSGPRKGASAK